LSIPEVRSSTGIYTFTWAQEQVAIKVDRFSENSHHELTAEVAIKTTVPGMPNHLHQARLNLTSTIARRTLVNYLTDRMNLDWQAMVEQMAVLVLQKYREGTPVLKLIDYSPKTGQTEYCLKPLLQQGQATMLYGDGETGKSYLAAYWSCLIALGHQEHNLVPLEGNVLYLDYETDADTTWERIDRITAGLGERFPENIHYRYCHQTVAADFEELRRQVYEKEISFVVVDSAAPAVEEPEAAHAVSAYFAALRGLRVTSLTVAHRVKNFRGAPDAPFGSVMWRNLARATFRTISTHEPGASMFTIGLKHTKNNNGVRLRDMGWRLEFDADSATFTPTDLLEVPELAESLTLSDRIAGALRHKALTISDLATSLDASEAVIRTTLNRNLQRFVQFDHDHAKYWGLKANVTA